MKRILALVLSIIMLFSLCACGNNEKAEKYCSSCGEGISKEVAFCEHCGAAVNNEKTESKDTSSDHSTSTESKIEKNSKPSSSTESTNKTTTNSTSSSSSQETSKPTIQTHTHTYSNYKCTGCGQMDKNSMFDYFKDWVIKKGALNGDYVYYSKSADTYGGYSDEDFSLYYWADTEQIEFCLHSVLDEEYSINFYIYIPKNYSGNYEYITSYYYRDTGESVCESKGIIMGKTFTKNHPLSSNKYTGSSSLQNNFMEMSRKGICDTLDCLKLFLQKEQIGYTWQDLGFEKYE